MNQACISYHIFEMDNNRKPNHYQHFLAIFLDLEMTQLCSLNYMSSLLIKVLLFNLFKNLVNICDICIAIVFGIVVFGTFWRFWKLVF